MADTTSDAPAPAAATTAADVAGIETVESGGGGGGAGGGAGAATAAAAGGGADSGAGGDAGADADGGFDSSTKKIVQKIPLLSIRAGPRDADWKKRLKQEYKALIQYIKINKENDNDWFTIKPDKSGTHWEGKCWYFYEHLKYEFKLEFEIPVTYPETNPDVVLPELQGKTVKMYRGGKICLSIHFMPLWARNVPSFGVAHILVLGLAPWLAAEVPHLVKNGLITPV